MTQHLPDIDRLRNALEQLFGGFEEIYESVKENEHKSRKFGEIVDDHKTAFDVARQMTRPHEFLTTMLDLIRVNYEPFPLGTMMLNANLCFVAEMLEQHQTKIGYASMVSDSDQAFGEFWDKKVFPHLEGLGYQLAWDSRVVLICSTGENRYGLELLTAVNDHLDIGLGVTDAYNMMKQHSSNYPLQTVAGYCMDNSLDNKIRASMLILQGTAKNRYFAS